MFQASADGATSSVPPRFLIVLALTVALGAAIPSAAAAPKRLWMRGVVLAPAGTPLVGASVTIDTGASVVTGEDGRFAIEAPRGEREIQVRHPGYRTLSSRLTLAEESLHVELRLEAALSVAAAITVEGIRAGEELPVTQRTLERDEIEKLSHGQDVPALLQHSPSMTWYSDSGTGSNYSYFSLRGIQQSRINMTFDGAPLNDPAEHALFFNNFHDFASAVDSIQIQRGVGTSSVGAPSYGGSINFASRPLSSRPGADLRLVLGSDDTRRASLGFESGRFDNGFAASGRVSLADTDGYRERSGTRHGTLFLNAE